MGPEKSFLEGENEILWRDERRGSWQVAMNKEYKTQFEQGYKFLTNVNKDDVPRAIRKYGAKGMEIFIGEKALCLQKAPQYAQI